jgi:hypothetical protein
MIGDDGLLAASHVNTVVFSVLGAIAVATVSAVLADRLKRRSDRQERKQARLELVDVSFTRADDEFESLTLEITVRNLSDTMACPIQAARFSGIEVWQFPFPMMPSFRPVSQTYDADLGGDSDHVVLHQGIAAGEIERFAIRLGTSRPLAPGRGSFLYLFDLELVLNSPTATLDLGRFLVDLRQPVRLHGWHGTSGATEWHQQLAERARQLAEIVETDTYVEVRARKVLDNLSAVPPAEPDVPGSE